MSLEHYGKSKCPYCNSTNQEYGYMHGKELNACVIKCKKCGKDFFCESRPGSINYKIEMDNGDIDYERLNRLKQDYGYVK